MNGKDILGINGFSFGMIIILLLTIIGAIFYYEYYSKLIIVDNVRRKVQKTDYPIIIYQYGRSQEEIVNKLSLDIIPVVGLQLQDLINYIMSNDNIDLLLRLYTKENKHTKYDLFWYLCISEDPYNNRLTTKEIEYILSLDNEQLLNLLGSSYQGCNNRACLIFSCLSGQMIPEININNEERYKQVIKYNPKIAYNLSFVQNKIIDHNNGIYSLYGPYMYLSTVQPSLIENIIGNITENNFNETITKLGLIEPTNFNSMTNNEKVDYLQGELSLYHNNLFIRPQGPRVPRKLANKSRDEIYNILLQYTNQELANFYEPRSKWNSRSQLLNLICDDVLGIPKWSIHSKLYCNNENSMNIITGELHSEMSKYDDSDPTLSYGTHKNYRCYQLSELIASFREYNGVFMFAVPDWVTTSDFAREFPLESIKQLRYLLEKDQFKDLILKIDEGLEYMKSAEMKIRSLKNNLDKFTYEQKQIVDLYLGWMFNYSMWMRFWKGPGYPWPLVKVNVVRTLDRNIAQRSSPQERDENIFIQEGIRTQIIEMYEKDKMLRNWIENLPTIYYDFDTKQASCASHNIKNLLEQIALGNECMGFGSDTILKTSYYYITELLNHKEGKLFDNFVTRMLPKLLDLEYNIVSNRLMSNQTGIRKTVLSQRLQSLESSVPKLLPFITTDYQNNVHVES